MRCDGAAELSRGASGGLREQEVASPIEAQQRKIKASGTVVTGDSTRWEWAIEGLKHEPYGQKNLLFG